MSLKPFTYPFPETRFLHAGSNVYKFKIRYGNSIRGEEIENKEIIVQELEDSIRVVLGNLDNLQPFATKHFIVFPYKSKWERVSHLKFKHGEMVLIPCPFVFTLYVEMKWFHENLSLGKPINDSPFELVLAEEKAAEAMMRKRKCMEEPSSPSRPGLNRAKMETSNQGPSKKKPPAETRMELIIELKEECTLGDLGTLPLWALSDFRQSPLLCLSSFKENRERKSQQEWEETLASDITDVQEQDSKRGDFLAGPPLQQNNAPPPKELGTSGFFGFLSSLFPIRYFFRKNSQ